MAMVVVLVAPTAWTMRVIGQKREREKERGREREREGERKREREGDIYMYI